MHICAQFFYLLFNYLLVHSCQLLVFHYTLTGSLFRCKMAELLLLTHNSNNMAATNEALFRPQGYVQKAFNKTEDLTDAISNVQDENQVKLPSFQAAVPLLDLHGLQREEASGETNESTRSRSRAFSPFLRCFRFTKVYSIGWKAD